MKAAIVIIAIVIVLIIFSPMMTGIKDARSDNRTDSITCATAAASTNGTVVLVSSLFNNAISEVSSITSSLGTDVPNPESYASATRTLTVNGLTANTSRTLTVNYATAGLSDYTGADTFLKLIPLLVAVVLGVIAIAQVMGAFKR